MKNYIRILQIDDKYQLEKEMKFLGVDAGGIEKMIPKGDFYLIKIKNLSPVVCNILKQELLSKNGEAAVHRSVITHKIEKSDVILMGTAKVLRDFLNGLTGHYFGIPELRDLIEKVIYNFNSAPHSFKIRDKKFNWDGNPYLMGIVNTTPDSFSDGGEFFDTDKAVDHALKMIEQGADIIDIGGESSRPGADPVTEEQEQDRVIPVIQEIRKISEVPISIDTYKTSTAKLALDNGADLINDISAGSDPAMFKLAAEFDVPVCLMHMKGTPENMQKDPKYDNLMDELFEFFKLRIQKAQASGIKEKIILDPGIGFGKRLCDNLEIIRRLKEFKSLGYPILIGPSRKSFIGMVTGGDVKDRMEGTAAAVALSIYNGANIIRVHDVKQMGRVKDMTYAIKTGELK